jgi:hypothetical protein
MNTNKSRKPELEGDADTIQKCLSTAFQLKKGCLIGRNGSTDVETILFWFKFRKDKSATEKIPYPEQLLGWIMRVTGFFATRHFQPNYNTMSKNELYNAIDDYASILYSCMQHTNVIVKPWYSAKMNEETFLQMMACPNAKKIDLCALEPFYVKPSKQWTSLFAGKRVGLVNAFANTAIEQTKNRKAVWGDFADTMMPENTEWIPIVSYYSDNIADGRAEWPREVLNWKMAVDYLEKQCIDAKIDAAIMGCGALGMILATRLKKKGIACIVTGGGTQIMFGIKGKRWMNSPDVSCFFNDAWVFPSFEETPGNYLGIEGGCYWEP